MREIKFRAWHTVMQKMIDPYDGEYLSETTSLNSVIRGCQENEHQILMQYTGFKDKNGKEIFEGDVALYETSTKKHQGKIVPILGGYAWDHAGIEFHLWDMALQNLEIIGNIYENPELLK